MGILNNPILKKICFAWLNKTKNSNRVFYIEKNHRIKKSGKKNRIFLVNTPEYANLGDQLICIGELKFLKDNFPEKPIYEITQTQLMVDSEGFLNLINDDDIILITGGGFMGSVWDYSENLVRQIVEKVTCPVIVMPQTAFFADDKFGKTEFENSRAIYSKAKKLYMIARENNTYETFKCFVGEEKTLLIPDIAIYAGKDRLLENYKKDIDIVCCFRSDREANIGENIKQTVVNIISDLKLKTLMTDTVLDNNILYVEDRDAEVWKMAKTIGSGRLLITDRLHAMVFAILTNTQCIAFDNSTRKVSGVYSVLKNFGINTVTLIDKNEADKIDYKELINYLLMTNTANKYNLKEMYEPLVKLIKDLMIDEK